jgi:hypothetical protein
MRCCMPPRLGLFILLLLQTSASASDSGNDSGGEVPIDPGNRSQRVLPGAAQTNWNGVIRSSTRFLVVQHSFRVLTEPGTRKEFGGPFVGDYLRSVGAMRRWNDSDPFIVNYVGHPLMGAVTGYLYLNHTGSASDQRFGSGPGYWKLRLRAMTYSAAYSTQFEIGLLSEASLGNVGRDYRTMGGVDLVVTPLGGIGWLIAEDAIDRFFIEKIEDRSRSPFVRIAARCLLNPGRAFANLMDGKAPWKRARALRVARLWPD